MKSFADQSLKYVPIFSAILIAVSVVHDTVYLHTIGLSLSIVPTTIQDHARSAIVWLPWLLSVALLVALIGYGYIYLQAFGANVNPHYLTAFSAGLVFMGLLYFMIARTPWMLLVALAMVVSGCLALIKKLTPQKLIPLVVVIVILLVVMSGQNRAQNMLINGHKWSVDLNSIDGTQVVFASGVRSFSDVTVIVQIGGNVSVVKNADITKIELHESDADHDDKPYTYLQSIRDIFKHFLGKLNW